MKKRAETVEDTPSLTGNGGQNLYLHLEELIG